MITLALAGDVMLGLWADYALDTARACHERGIQAVGVTADYICPKARQPLQAVRAQKPRELIVAVPVASPDRLEEVRRWCDDAVCLLSPEMSWAVGQFYGDFTQVEDEEAVNLLRAAATALRLPAAASGQRVSTPLPLKGA